MSDTVIQITVDNQTYKLFLEELTARDTAALRRATGLSVREVLRNLRTDVDIDTAAALVFLAKRHEDPNVEFDAVAAQISYRSEFGIPAEVEADPPEVLAGQ